MTLEEKSMAYAEKRLRTAYPNMTISRPDKAVDLFDTFDMAQAYEDGATEALASQWQTIRTKPPLKPNEWRTNPFLCLSFDGRPFLSYYENTPDGPKWNNPEVYYWMSIPIPDKERLNNA